MLEAFLKYCIKHKLNSQGKIEMRHEFNDVKIIGNPELSRRHLVIFKTAVVFIAIDQNGTIFNYIKGVWTYGEESEE